MKNTNKKTLLMGIISLILVVGLIGGGIALVSKGLKKAEDTLDDAFGKLDTGVTDTSTESSAETVPADDTKLTFAEGEVHYGYRTNNSGGYTGFCFYSSELKTNTKYKISWSLDSTYGSYGFYFRYKNVDGISTPYGFWSFSSSFDPNSDFIPKIPYESEMINNFYEFTSDSNGYVEIMLLFSDDVTSDAVASRATAFKSLINYVEIEEVT